MNARASREIAAPCNHTAICQNKASLRGEGVLITYSGEPEASVEAHTSPVETSNLSESLSEIQTEITIESVRDLEISSAGKISILACSKISILVACDLT